jgi:hypothetical protein
VGRPLGAGQPGVDRETVRLVGDLTALANGRLVLLTADGEAHDLADVLAALVGAEPDAPGDRPIGRVSLVLEVLDWQQGSGQPGRRRRGRLPHGSG